jgi:predicted  nucleic acid-binding Zn-ribbon protein
MSEISDLKQRVEAVGAKFGRLAEQESSYGERLTDLLTAVEEGFARSQTETRKLNSDLESAQDEVKKLTGELDAAKEETRQRNRELDGVKEEKEKLSGELDGAKEEREKLSGELDGAKKEREKLSSELDGAKEERDKISSEIDGAREESKQLRGMVQTLLEAVESGGSLDLGDAMRNLESRIDRIVTSTDDHDADLGAKPKAAPKEPANDTPEPAKAIPAEAIPADSTPAEEAPAAEEPSAEQTESAKEEPLELTSGAEPSAEAEPPAPAETDKDEAGPEDAVASAAEPEDEAAEPPSDDDLSAVNKIIQRISLLTGEFVEPSQKKSDGTEEKPIPSLKVGNGADDAPGAGSRKSKASSKDETAAKTT